VIEYDTFQTQAAFLVQYPTVSSMIAPKKPLDVFDECRLGDGGVISPPTETSSSTGVKHVACVVLAPLNEVGKIIH
jgi:hypothetical protein